MSNSLSGFTQYLPRFPEIPNFLAIWRPVAFEKDRNSRFEVDDTALILRTAAVGVVSLTALAASLTRESVRSSPSLPVILDLASIFSTPIIALVGSIYIAWENSRAVNSATKQAIKEYMDSKNDQVPKEVMVYLVTNPTAMRMLLAQTNVDLTKVDSTDGKTLLDHSIDRANICNVYGDNRSMLLLSLNLLIQKADSLSREQILKMFPRTPSRFDEFDFTPVLITALENDKIKPTDFTNDQIHDLWTRIETDKDALAQALIEKGFSIDALSEKNLTLLHSILQNNFEKGGSLQNPEKIRFLIKHGASLPKDDTLIEIIRNNGGDKEIIRKTYGEFLQENQELKIFLEHSKPQKKPLELQSRIWSLSPSIDVGGKYNSFKVDKDCIFIRSLVIAFPIINTLSFVLAIQLATPLPLCLLAAAPLLYKYDYSRAVKALNKIAIEQFQNTSVSTAQLEYIASDGVLIDQLIKENADFLISDDNGRTLFDTMIQNERLFSPLGHLKFEARFANFVKIADATFNQISSSEELRKKMFVKAVASSHCQYARYLLEKNWVNVGDFTREEQFDLWTKMGDPGTATILKNAGFDPNVKNMENERGFTPLLYVLQHHVRSLSANRYQIVKALLEADADASATMEVRQTLDTTKTVNCLILTESSPQLNGLIKKALENKNQ